MVFSHTYIKTWIVDSAPLTYEDVACLYNLIAKFLDTESLAM